MSTTTSIPASDLRRRLLDQLTSVVAVREDVLDPLLAALFAGGHVLVEGVPGTGKTLLARTLAQSVDCSFNRLQFTNDLMPSDVVGSMVWRASTETFEFVRGPLFANIVLADEINRTSPRTLSCLLEAMENGSVTVEGEAHRLADPFLVLATRNPIEFHGTFPVPEAALDRFLVRVELDYPEPARELGLYLGDEPESLLAKLRPVLRRDALIAARDRLAEVVVREPVASYCFDVVQATREHPDALLGASPRAAMGWLRAARGRAMLDGRQHVLPDDLQALAEPVLVHRIVTKGGGDARRLVREALRRTPVGL